jgi:enediyne core biosynthesis thioesterase
MSAGWDLEHVVTFEETNLVGNVYFVNHVRWQGHCRELFLRQRAPGVLAQLAEGLALVTTSCSCQYFAELKAFDRVVVRMMLDGIQQNRISLRFDYLRMGRGAPELVARGDQEVACMRRDGDGLRATPVPTELCEALVPFACAPIAR